MKTVKLAKGKATICHSMGVLDHNENELATIYFDGDITFSCKSKISCLEMDQIEAVRKNFYLFFNNIN